MSALKSMAENKVFYNPQMQSGHQSVRRLIMDAPPHEDRIQKTLKLKNKQTFFEL